VRTEKGAHAGRDAEVERKDARRGGSAVSPGPRQCDSKVGDVGEGEKRKQTHMERGERGKET
jgi:hypothetical protein